MRASAHAPLYDVKGEPWQRSTGIHCRLKVCSMAAAAGSCRNARTGQHPEAHLHEACDERDDGDVDEVQDDAVQAAEQRVRAAGAADGVEHVACMQRHTRLPGRRRFP